jgi:GST-like protein
VQIDDLPHLKRWLDAIGRHPALQKGVTIPPSSMDLSKDDPESAKKFAEDALKMVETGQSQEKKG